MQCICIIFTARRNFVRDPSAPGCFQLNQQRNEWRSRPWMNIQHSAEEMTLSLPCWQSRNCRDGLSPERRIKRWAAPFVQQDNGKCIRALCPSIQTSGHHFEEKANCNARLGSARVRHTPPQWDLAPTSYLAVSVSSSTKKKQNLALQLLSASGEASTSTITDLFQAYHSTELMIILWSSFVKLSLT